MWSNIQIFVTMPTLVGQGQVCIIPLNKPTLNTPCLAQEFWTYLLQIESQ